MLNARHFVVAVACSPATVFLLFLGLFRVFYVNWAEQHVAEVAATNLSIRSCYTVKIDSVVVSLSSLKFFKVRVLQVGETIGEVDSIVLYEPSLLRLILQRKLVTRHVDVSPIRTSRDDIRKFFVDRATFSCDPP